MSLSSILGGIVAFLSAMPTIAKIVDLFSGLWIAARKAVMQKEIWDGIVTAVTTGDQRDLEKAIGNPAAGEPSGLPGTTTRDTLPNLPQPKSTGGSVDNAPLSSISPRNPS